MDTEKFWNLVGELTPHKLKQLSRRKLYWYEGYIDCGIDRMSRDQRWEKAMALQGDIAGEFERRNRFWRGFLYSIPAFLLAIVALYRCHADNQPATQEHSRASSELFTTQQSPASQSTTTPAKLDVLPLPQTESSPLSPTPTMTPIKWPPPAP